MPVPETREQLGEAKATTMTDLQAATTEAKKKDKAGGMTTTIARLLSSQKNEKVFLFFNIPQRPILSLSKSTIKSLDSRILDARAKRLLLRRKRLERDERYRPQPGPGTGQELEYEKELRRVGTRFVFHVITNIAQGLFFTKIMGDRGVVVLFNAIRHAQKIHQTTVDDTAGKIGKERGQVRQEVGREGFKSMISAQRDLHREDAVVEAVDWIR